MSDKDEDKSPEKNPLEAFEAGMPEIPSLRAAAIQMHEMYESFVLAGFSRKEAMDLTVKVTLGTMDN